MAIIEGNYVHFAQYQEYLLPNLYQFYMCNKYVDMSLVCHGIEILVHKAVIAAASPLLKERINGFENTYTRINVEHEVSGLDINIDDIKLLVEFIYKGRVSVPEVRLSLFLAVGSNLQVYGLYGQTPNVGNQPSFIPQPVLSTTYPVTQPALANTGFGCQQSQENYPYEDPPDLQNDFSNHVFHGIFTNTSFMSPEKLSDSTIKQDKSLSGSISNTTFSDLCTGNGPPVDLYDTQDVNVPSRFHTEEANPKVSSNFQQYTNEASAQEVDFVTIPENQFSSDFPDDDMQTLDEHTKDIFEDRVFVSSSVASDPDVLFPTLNNQPNSLFHSESLNMGISTDHGSLPEMSFQSCKISTHSPLPERQMRLKVKDSIGGVSLQDTSQGEKNNCMYKNTPICYEEVPVPTDSLNNPVEVELCPEVIVEDSTEGLPIPQQQACSQCQKTFPPEYNLLNHLYEVHSIGTMHKCLICSFHTFVENGLVEHGKTHLSSVDRQCCICGKKFKTRTTLRNHLSTHASDNWFKCSECTAHYSQRNNLSKHMASVHRLDMEGTPIEEPFSCPHCSYVTWAPHKLKNHKVRCHTQNKRFQCSECNYSTTEKPALTKHTRIHTNERPYVCEMCSISFVTMSSLKRHHRGHTKEKPFICDECGQKYADKKRLRDHLLKHKSIKPFNCLYCDYTSRRKDNMQSHVKRSHTKTDETENVKEVGKLDAVK